MFRIVLLGAAAALAAACAAHTPALVGKHPHLVLSGNDGKYPNNDGAYKVADAPRKDTLTVLDATGFPPRKVAEIEIQHTPIGPPMTIAVTADEKLALVSAPNHVDPNDKTKIVTDNFMQVVDLEATPPRIIDRVQLGKHPLGVSVNRAGTLALAGHVDGTVSVLSIDGKSVKLVENVKVGDAVSSVRMASITPDGRWGFAVKRGNGTVAVLKIEGTKVTYTNRDITAGNNAYGMEISNDGRFAVVPNVGNNDGSVGSLTVIDLTREPFRAVEHVTIGLGPEGVAISPDGQWVAVSAQNGTNRPHKDPYYTANSRVELYAMQGFKPVKVGEAFAGRNIQGIVFTPDGKHIVVQNYVEQELAIYRVTPKGPEDTGQRIPVPGYPSGLRTAIR